MTSPSLWFFSTFLRNFGELGAFPGNRGTARRVVISPWGNHTPPRGAKIPEKNLKFLKFPKIPAMKTTLSHDVIDNRDDVIDEGASTALKASATAVLSATRTCRVFINTYFVA